MVARETSVAVRNIKKSFKVPLDNSSSIKQHLINFYKRQKGYRVFDVLNDVSFEIEKGDFFGIVGRNGSGKSTLLKLLAGIYNPESGSVSVNGSVVPFIELGVGFNPELTGRENVYLNGALLGFSRSDMDEMYGNIVEFAELEKFMDQKLKNYSSGMQVRLAFSIAIQAQGDVLILDEVLAVGDEAFQKKCDMFFEKIRKDKTKTVILVTHSMDSVRKYCNKAMLLSNGHVVAIDNPDEIADQYSALNLKSDQTLDTARHDYSVDMRINPVIDDHKIIFRVNILAKDNVKDAVFALSLRHEYLGFIFWASYKNGLETISLKKGEDKTFNLEVDNIFPTDNYLIDANLRTEDTINRFGRVDAQLFHNKHKTKYHRSYSFLPQMTWTDEK